MKRLGVSKALVSFSIADLLEYRVIEQVSKGPRRTVYFQANPNLTDVIFNVLHNREKKILASVLAAQQALAAEQAPSRSPFNGLARTSSPLDSSKGSSPALPSSDESQRVDPQRVHALGEFVASAAAMLDFFLESEKDSLALNSSAGAHSGVRSGAPSEIHSERGRAESGQASGPSESERLTHPFESPQFSVKTRSKKRD